MPGYELIGLYDCPFMAKAEKLLEQVQFQFPIVEYQKSMKDKIQWRDFVEKMKDVRGWTIKRSPVIWEVLTSPKGKVNYIGDIDDFCEYIYAFFGILCENDSTGALLQQVSKNKALFGRGFQGLYRGNKIVWNTAIINGSMKTLECIFIQLLSSAMSSKILFNIKLYSDTLSQRELDGLTMEAIDLASPNLLKVSVTTSLTEVLYDSHLILLLDDYTKRIDEEVPDWFNRIEWSAFKTAEMVNQICSNNCRVIIVGDGPQCFIAEIFRKVISDNKVKPGHLIAVGNHVVNRARAVISRKVKVPCGCIGGINAWGWPGSIGVFMEVKDAVVRDAECSIQGPSPCEIPLEEIGLHPEWLFNYFADEYLALQYERIFKTRNFASTDLCLAEAVGSTLRIWFTSQESIHELPNDQKSNNLIRLNLKTNEIITDDNNNSRTEEDIDFETIELLKLPILSVGIECPKNSCFPHGTFMVQPAVCYYGKWFPAGKVSERISREVFNLWERRNEMIFSQQSVKGVFSDYDVLVYGKINKEEEEAKEDDEYFGEDA